MKKVMKPVLSILMVLTIVLVSAPPVYAAGAQAPKQEVVYARLADDGSTQGVYVVNKFTVAQAGTVTDYGSYAAVRNMTDNNELASEAGQVRFEAPAGQFYYEGMLEGAQLPWLLLFRYTLDGRELPAQELAGKSGTLRIEIDIAQNPKAEPNFFDEYALQLTMLLDTGRCQNIVANGATAALVGSDSQLTYTVLPGSEKSIAITADVQDFEMEPISINGVRLNLDFEVDDEELLEQVLELMDGARELDDGAGELLDGAGELKDGVAELQNGAQAMVDGVATIQGGIDTLNGKSSLLTDGSASMLAALQQLQAELAGMSVGAEDIGQLVQASAAIQQGIDNAAAGAGALQANLSYDAYLAAMQGGGADIAALRTGNEQTAAALQGLIDSGTLEEGTAQTLQAAIGMLNANNGAIDGTAAYFGGLSSAADPLVAGLGELNGSYTAFHTNIAQLADTLAALPNTMGKLKSAIDTLVAEYTTLDSGIREYTVGVAALVAGFTELKSGADSLLAGTAELAEGVDTLQDGCAELAEGTTTLREETDGMDKKITERIDEMLEVIGGEDRGAAVSFVSAQNRHVTGVQFVMRTSGIEVPEGVAAVESKQEEPGLWEKFTALFS